MVNKDYILKVVRALELYYINSNNKELDGSSYALILFIPVVRYENKYKYNIIVSAKRFDIYSRKKIIADILSWFNQTLSKQEAEKIESVVVANSNSPFVKNIDFIIPIKQGIKELDSISVGGVDIHYGILVYSNLLTKLIPGNAITAKLKDGQTINMGVDIIDKDLNIYYYTGKGLRELFAPGRNEEQIENAKKIKEKGKDYLLENFYYGSINLGEITEIS